MTTSIDNLRKKIEKLEKRKKKLNVNLNNDELYDSIIKNSFKRLSKSRKLAVKFLISAGIFNKEGHLSDEYKNKDIMNNYEDISHYAEIYKRLNWAELNENSKEVETFSNSRDVTNVLVIPKGLSDEDKLLCAIFSNMDRDCVTQTKYLNNVFKWDKKHSIKVRKNLPLVITVSAFCEDGGYGGRGWIVNDSVMEYIKDEKEKK